MRYFRYIRLVMVFFFLVISLSLQEGDKKHLAGSERNLNFPFNFAYDEMNAELEEYSNLDLTKFQKYQTFDEYRMKPIGKQKEEPFIYYYKRNDSIIVIPSNDKEDISVYIRHGKHWFNHKHLELWRVNHPVCKCYKGKFARSYYRICGNDSIIECKCDYLDVDQCLKTLYIKTLNKCEMIILENDIKNVDKVYEDMLALVKDISTSKVSSNFCLLNGNKRDCYSFKLILKKKYFIRKGVNRNVKLVYKRNSLDKWILQPGLENFDTLLSVPNDN